MRWERFPGPKSARHTQNWASDTAQAAYPQTVALATPDQIKIDYLISAAQRFTHLCTNCAERKPERESQLRPLIGLTPEQAQLAWERAVEKAAGRKITARLVKAAVQELQLAPATKPATREPRQTKAEKRRLIDEAIGQLLILLSQKASHAILTEKVEALHGHIQSLFATSSQPQTETKQGEHDDGA